MTTDTAFDAQIARDLPDSQALQLHVLPAHQELIAPLPTGYVGPVMVDAEAWLKQHGYRTLGPWMISWGPNGQPQLRRPVSGALKAIKDKSFQTVEVPEQLLVAVPFVGWPILPHNFTHAVTAVQLEMAGMPLLLALTQDPPTMAWIPVVPRGTRGLFARRNDKLGLHPPAPKPGAEVSVNTAWFTALFRVGRFMTSMSILVVLLISAILFIAILSGNIELIGLDVFFVSVVGFFLFSALTPWLVGLGMVVWFINGLVLASAINNWNRFWFNKPMPPELLLGSRGEGQVGAWLG